MVYRPTERQNYLLQEGVLINCASIIDILGNTYTLLFLRQLNMVTLLKAVTCGSQSCTPMILGKPGDKPILPTPPSVRK